MLQSGATEEQAAYAAAWSGGSPAQARQILADEQLADIRSHAEAIAVRLSTKRNPSMYLIDVYKRQHASRTKRFNGSLRAEDKLT